MTERTEREDSSVVGSSSTIEADDECVLPAFGYPEYNYGWVECNSKTFPGKSYYFNVDSRCSTWSRPVSRFVSTPPVRPLNLMSDEDFLDVAPIIVSDIEDEDDDYNNNNNNSKIHDVEPPKISRKAAREKKIFEEVMFKLYHCYGGEWNIAKTEEVESLAREPSPFQCEEFEEDSNDNFAIMMPETCYSSGSEDESSGAICANNSALSESFGSSYDFTSWDRKSSETFLSQRAVDSREGKSSESSKSPSTVLLNKWKSPANEGTPRKLFSKKKTSFDGPMGHESLAGIPKGACDISNALNCLKVNSVDSESEKRENVSADTTLSYEAFGQLELTFDGEEEEEEVDYKNWAKKNLYSLPKLKAIEFEDLLTESLRDKASKKKRKREAPKCSEIEKKNPPKRVMKTVCVLNGVTTINYDYLAPDLPEGVKMSNLSDSGSSTCHDVWHALRDNERSVENSSNKETGEVAKTFNIIHGLSDITEPRLSESSTSSSASVKSDGAEIKERVGLPILSRSSESDSSDFSTSSASSESSGSLKNNNKPKLPGVANKNVKNRSDSSSLANSKKSWSCNSSSHD